MKIKLKLSKENGNKLYVSMSSSVHNTQYLCQYYNEIISENQYLFKCGGWSVAAGEAEMAGEAAVWRLIENNEGVVKLACWQRGRSDDMAFLNAWQRPIKIISPFQQENK